MSTFSTVMLNSNTLLTAIGFIMYLRIIQARLPKSYRSQECYRIMIHIGITQCLFAPGTIINTTRVLTGANFWILPEITTKLFPSESRMEALMSVALALNRLKVMCELRYPSAIHTAIVAFAWVFGIVNYGLLFSPWYNYYISDEDYLSHYDMSKPLTATMKTMGSVLIFCCSVLQLVLYTIIVAYIIRMQGKLSKKLQSRKEMNILLYACARFLFDVVPVCAVYGYIPVPNTELAHICVLVAYSFNRVALQPVLYLLLNRDVRGDFIPRRTTVVVKSVSVIHRK
ncbi:hypothetical protein QR680_009993 [Steinernema hermaphroditum]|uniref:7TM GPCR serpentine receptor class x (Srx) domain-containing protein n=1 Tax=Steinernema hermaphroditum TaxID=289476 RepID=A0AA39MAY5_9BILA|nr:hypothetical protein QR680_009993 [Steinernema hermaphroditum]